MSRQLQRYPRDLTMQGALDANVLPAMQEKALIARQLKR